MIKNYFKIAWRNIVRNKAFSLLNILGLTAGTVCCLYIFLYVADQYGYDTQHHDAASIYRIRTIIEGKDNRGFNSATTSPPIATTMKMDFPEVAAATRVLNFSDGGDNLLSVVGSDRSFYEPKGYLVDSTFFQIFNYKFIEGTPLHSLDEPYTVVLSSVVAKKLFGDSPALNQQINISNRISAHVFKITGVFDETYGKTHLHPHFIMNMNSGGIGEFVRTNNQWAGQNFVYSYVKLNPNADVIALQNKLPAFLLKHGADNLKELGMKKQLFLQKVTDINLYSKGITNQIDEVSNARFLYLLLTIAFFIQLIACINFINLTTARSVRRAREIGIRKVAGAVKSSLVGQFLSESVLISFIAVFLAVPIVIILLPFLNSLTGSTLTIHSFRNLKIISTIGGLGIITGLLAGIYPALYLSGFKPVSVLKGTFSFKASSVFLRKGLVIFQFVIAIVLIISVIIISRQLNYMQSKDLGFDQKQKLIIPFQNDQSRRQFMAFNNELLQLKGVSATAGCDYYPSLYVLSDYLAYKAGQDMNTGKDVKVNRVNENFFKTLGIRITAGRNLRTSDTSNQVVVNEKTLKIFGLQKETAVGNKLYSDFEGGHNEFEIVGVTSDYNYSSLKEEIQPLMAFYSATPSYMVVEATTANYKQLLSDIGGVWKKTIQGAPFEYSFLDSEIQKQYTDENSLKKISNSFTLLAILISCLGLFGLAMFTAQQRIKEIGVRKVLGASVTGIASMLSRDFLKLVFISILIASPIAWWAMNKWLQDFVYKTDISWWVFVLAGMVALLIAFATVSFQAIKAAIANPVKSLRTE
ncbi:MAG TPA: ABC transporter permease [Chitinophagaceae bacterium]|nr:ABC transporter permease [Chitinophagaceae bacterium]